MAVYDGSLSWAASYAGVVHQKAGHQHVQSDEFFGKSICGKSKSFVSIACGSCARRLCCRFWSPRPGAIGKSVRTFPYYSKYDVPIGSTQRGMS